MMQKAFQIIKEAGVTGLGNRAVAFAYRRGIRPWLPSAGPVHYAGIPIAYNRKWGDRTVPSLWFPDSVEDAPGYESALVTGLREHVRVGDRVVVVGGGVGVTATIAALEVGSTGSVQCFEGAGEGVEKVRRTAEINGVSEWLTVHHAVVARSISVYGTEPDHAVVAPAELPECDVLELDCEGAEVDILQGMRIRPRVILVETHGYYGAPTSLISSLLQGLGYRVSDCGVAEPRGRALCEARDIHVLIGELEGESDIA